MDMSGFSYICAAGETFDSVAREIYGDEIHAAPLLCANPEYATRSVFTGEEILYLPVVSVLPAEQAELPATPPWKE